MAVTPLSVCSTHRAGPPEVYPGQRFLHHTLLLISRLPSHPSPVSLSSAPSHPSPASLSSAASVTRRFGSICIQMKVSGYKCLPLPHPCAPSLPEAQARCPIDGDTSVGTICLLLSALLLSPRDSAAGLAGVPPL